MTAYMKRDLCIGCRIGLAAVALAVIATTLDVPSVSASHPVSASDDDDLCLFPSDGAHSATKSSRQTTTVKPMPANASDDDDVENASESSAASDSDVSDSDVSDESVRVEDVVEVGSAVRRREDAEKKKNSDVKPAAKPTAKSKAKSAVVDSDSVEEDELTLEQQQARDQGECPGSEEPTRPMVLQADDLPLDQDEHPFDAPTAKSDADADDEHVAEIVRKIPEPPPTGTDPALRPASQLLHTRINSCLAYYFTHPENLAARSPWAVMHTILPYGVETEIVAGNRSVNAIGWMCYNGVCKTQRMFQPTQKGFRTNVGPGVQGHEGQFLAILAQSSVPRDFPILVGKTRYTISDLIRYEMGSCREKSELTFKLIGLSHYLSPRQSWRDDRGQVWNLEKLVREELEQPVVGAACGGTHRLMGLSYALMMRRRYREPVNGHWARADAYIKDFVQYAWSLQNPDGSFSTDWFEGRANEPDMQRKLQTSGHILEWLIFTLPADDLDDPRLEKAVEFLLSQVYDHRDEDWPIGPRGHALRAISLYNQRVFGAPTGQLKNYLAQTGFVKPRR